MNDVTAAADQLAREGRVTEAYVRLTEAAERGDGNACFMLADWRMRGRLIRRDIVAARDWFGRAAQCGRLDAWGPYIALLANGAGGRSPAWPEALRVLGERANTDPHARTQLELLEAMGLDGEGNPQALAGSKTVSEKPLVIFWPRFLTPRECAYLIAVAEPLLQPSVVVHPTTGQMVRDPIRTSDSAAFPLVREEPVLHAVGRRIAAASRTAHEQGEPFQVLRYAPGQEYRPHSDALTASDNQRIYTFLVYLNEDYEGGETRFLSNGLTVKGKTGDGLLFRNVDQTGEPDLSARHAGLPVTSGQKLLLSRWIREKPLDLSGPPGRPF